MFIQLNRRSVIYLKHGALGTVYHCFVPGVAALAAAVGNGELVERQRVKAGVFGAWVKALVVAHVCVGLVSVRF